MRISDFRSDVCSSDLFITTISPRFDIRGIGARGLSLGATGYGEVSRYLENSSENAESYGAAVRADYDWTQAQKLGASLSYYHLTESRRSEERRVGKECVSTCRSRWWTYH